MRHSFTMLNSFAPDVPSRRSCQQRVRVGTPLWCLDRQSENVHGGVAHASSLFVLPQLRGVAQGNGGRKRRGKVKRCDAAHCDGAMPARFSDDWTVYRRTTVGESQCDYHTTGRCARTATAAGQRAGEWGKEEKSKVQCCPMVSAHACTIL